MASVQRLSLIHQLLMASSEVDQKFLGKYAQYVSNSNPFLSSWLYRVLGLSVVLSKKLVRARRLRKLDTTRDTKSLQLYNHIIWLAREGLVMVEQYIVPMTEGYIELKVLAHKLRASFYHIYVLFHNQPSINQAAIPSFSSNKGKGIDRSSIRSSPNPMEGGPVQMPSLPPGLAPVAIPKPSASFLLPPDNYIPRASSCFSRAALLSETMLSGSHPLRLSVKTEFSAYVYDCLHDGETSRQIAQQAIRDVYNAQEGMDDEMFEDAAELVAILGKFMKRGLGSSGTSSTPRVGSVGTPETPRRNTNTRGGSGSTPGTAETVVPATENPRQTRRG